MRSVWVLGGCMNPAVLILLTSCLLALVTAVLAVRQRARAVRDAEDWSAQLEAERAAHRDGLTLVQSERDGYMAAVREVRATAVEQDRKKSEVIARLHGALDLIRTKSTQRSIKTIADWRKWK